MKTTSVPNLVTATTAPYVMAHMTDTQVERFVEDQRRRWASECEQRDGHNSRCSLAFYDAFGELYAAERAASFPEHRQRGHLTSVK